MGRPLFDDGRVADTDSWSRTDYAHNRSNPKKKKKTLTLGVRDAAIITTYTISTGTLDLVPLPITTRTTH